MNYEVEMGKEMLRLYKSKSSDQYAIYSLIQEDLKFVCECLKKLKQIVESGEENPLVCEALFNAALIRLYSCFDGNKALKKSILDELPEGAREAFSFFKSYRDKHISHKVNPIDQMKPGVILAERNSQEKGVIAVGCFGMKDISFLDPSFINSSFVFAEALMKRVSEKHKELEAEVLKEAQAKDQEKMYRLPSVKVVVPNSDHLHKNRS